MAQFPLVEVVALDMCSSAHGPASATAIDYVEAHNRARAPVGVGPLKWSESLATAATRVVIHQRDNNHCDLAADPNSFDLLRHQVWLQPVLDNCQDADGDAPHGGGKLGGGEAVLRPRQ